MPPEIENVKNLDLPKDAERILREMFSDHQRVVIKGELGGGYSGSQVFVVRPVKGRRAELFTVVKFASVSLAQKERDAYQAHIYNRLLGVAEMRQAVTLPDCDWAGLSYPFLGGGLFEVETLHDYCRKADSKDVQFVLERLLKMLRTLLAQSDAYPEFYWQASYDPVLPNNLLIEPQSPPPGKTPHLVKPGKLHEAQLQPGDHVRLEGFAVTKVDLKDRTVTLNLPRPANKPLASYRARLKLVEATDAYHVNEVIAPVEGVVLETRQNQLQAKSAQVMGQEADVAHEIILLSNGVRVPNPLLGLSKVLKQQRDVRVASVHGDLNLGNVLIDPETRNVHLIDFSEAREDHVLHDFLRLETEVMVKLVPEALSQHALPNSTVFDFYQKLHCATFGDAPHFSPRLPCDDLDKYFGMLVSVRQAARNYLYAGDPSEYYQGLFLYLLGALKFGNLAREPKQVAFLGAATVQSLWETPPLCEAFLSGGDDAETPLAVVLKVKPQVKVERKDTDHLVTATFGMPLYRDDVVSTYANAAARVHCENGLVLDIPAQRNQAIDCQDGPDERIVARLPQDLVNQSASFGDILRPNQALFATGLPQAGEPADLLLLHPRNTLVAETCPAFQWQHVEGATRYRLLLRAPDGKTWSRETRHTVLPYPDEAAPLSPGSVYSVTLASPDLGGAAEKTQLRVLDQSSLAEVGAAEAAMRALPLDRASKSYLLAQLYRGWKLWSAAIGQLEGLLQVEEHVSPGVWQQLGDLYFQVALYPQAQGAYQTALDVAQAGADESAQAAARVGLACACYAQDEVELALTYLRAVTAREYAEVVRVLYARMGGTSEEAPVYKGPAILSDYARFLVENLAPHLVDEVKRISGAFLERLEALGQPRLRREAVPVGLDHEMFEAMELLAAAHLTTRTLVETLSCADIVAQAQTGQLSNTLVDQARKTAQESVGLDSERAQSFAEQYAALVARDPGALRALIEKCHD
jgi:tetratricopeptide (TPR) repeat protein